MSRSSGSEGNGAARRAALALLAMAVLVLALAAVVAAAAKNSKGATRSLVAPLAAGGKAATGVKCPDNNHATGGGFAISSGFDPATKSGAQTYPQISFPPGKLKWRAEAASPAGEPATGLTTYVRCEKDSFGKIATRVSRSTIIASGIAKTVSATCPSGTQVLGGGYSVSPPFDAAAANKTTSTLRILESRRSSSGSRWTVSATNPAQPTTQLTVSALCEKHGREVKTRSAFASLAQKSRQEVAVKCSENQHVVAGGFTVVPLFSNVGVPVVDMSMPADSRTWRVVAYGAANIPNGSGITAFAYCKSNKRPD